MVWRLATLIGGAVLSASVLASTEQGPARPVPVSSHSSTADAQAIIDKTCAGCHNARIQNGNLSLEGFTIDKAAAQRDVSERMIRKLRAGQMPPAGGRRPAEEQLTALAAALEARLDAEAEAMPGRRTFQRLNRTEYARAIRDLLALDIDAGD